jgi:hypothetical protein
LPPKSLIRRLGRLKRPRRAPSDTQIAVGSIGYLAGLPSFNTPIPSRREQRVCRRSPVPGERTRLLPPAAPLMCRQTRQECRKCRSDTPDRRCNYAVLVALPFPVSQWRGGCQRYRGDPLPSTSLLEDERPALLLLPLKGKIDGISLMFISLGIGTDRPKFKMDLSVGAGAAGHGVMGARRSPWLPSGVPKGARGSYAS